MKIGLFRRIYDAVAGPPHVEGQGGGEDSMLEARVAALGAAPGLAAGASTPGGHMPASAKVDYVPSQQDEKPDDVE